MGQLGHAEDDDHNHGAVVGSGPYSTLTYMDLRGAVRLERVLCEVEWGADDSGDEGSTPSQCWGDGLGMFGGQAALQGGKVGTGSQELHT